MQSDQKLLLYEGKAKRIFKTDDPDRVLVEYKNDATAFNALKKSEFEGKGRLNCQISSILFELLESEGVPTHYLGIVDENLMMAQKVDVIPLEVVLRNIATGSLCRETPILSGTEISPALLDLYYKDDALQDPLLTNARLEVLNLISKERYNQIENLARKVNKILSNFLSKVDLILVDFKLEMGVNTNGNLVVADEISPDTCRIWDKRTKDLNDRILDKDRFRKDLGGIVQAYEEIFNRIKGISSNPRIYK